MQPVLSSRAPTAHPVPSSQSGGGPPAQKPSVQASRVVQGFASSHALPSATGSLMQPNTGSQLSAVQVLASFPASAVIESSPQSHGTAPPPPAAPQRRGPAAAAGAT